MYCDRGGGIKFPALLFYLKSRTELNKERTWPITVPRDSFFRGVQLSCKLPGWQPLPDSWSWPAPSPGKLWWMWAAACGGGFSGNDAQEQLSNRPRHPGPLSRSLISTQEGTRQSSPSQTLLFCETDCPQTVWQALGPHICQCRTIGGHFSFRFK